MNYYFIYHKHLADIITSYTYLTGRMPMPPLWSLGYQQNRYSYYPQAEVMRIARTLREKRILDNLWQSEQATWKVWK